MFQDPFLSFDSLIGRDTGPDREWRVHRDVNNFLGLQSIYCSGGIKHQRKGTGLRRTGYLISCRHRNERENMRGARVMHQDGLMGCARGMHHFSQLIWLEWRREAPCVDIPDIPGRWLSYSRRLIKETTESLFLQRLRHLGLVASRYTLFPSPLFLHERLRTRIIDSLFRVVLGSADSFQSATGPASGSACSIPKLQ